MNMMPGAPFRWFAIPSLAAMLVIVALWGWLRVAGRTATDQDQTPVDSVLASAPRAPREGRDPENRLLFVFGRDRRFGLIDTLGRLVVEPEPGWTLSSSEGRAMVRRAGLAGFVDGTGRTVIEPVWQEAYPFSEGLAVVATGIERKHNPGLGFATEEGGTRGYIDRQGNVVIPPRFREARSFHDGVAWVSEGGRWGLIDRTGRYVIEPRFQVEPVAGFSSGLCPVWLGGAWSTEESATHFGYIDTTGATIVPARFRAAGSFSEGIAAIVKDGKLGFIDRSGRVTVAPRFEWGSVNLNTRLPTLSEGLVPVRVGGRYGFSDRQGRIVIEPLYDSASPFCEGLAAVEVDGRTGFIDQRGRTIVEPRFLRVDPFEGGIARVEVAFGEWGYIRRDGSFVWNPVASPGR